MEVTFLDLKSEGRGCLNKDLAGGMGTRTIIGDSLLARALEFVKRKGVRLPLISSAYLAAIFAEAHHNVKYFENTVVDGDLVLINSSIVDFRSELTATHRIKNAGGAKVGFHGPFASVKPEIFLEAADFVIQGEPEEAVIEIAKKGKIPSGVVESGPIENLDSLPFPYWEIFPINEYSYKPVITRKNFVTILTSRGCPFSCGYYCPYVLAQGSKWRARSVENVIDEMKYLAREYGVRGLDFRDPNFTLNKGRAGELARAMIKEGLDFYWSCETHLNVLDKDLLRLLYEAGLRNINVGVESADPEVLESSRRQKAVLEQQEEIIRICDQLGINVAAFYILGLSSDTIKTVERTINYAKHLNTNVAQFTICTPYPGTKFYEEVKDRILTDDWEEFNAYTPVYRHENLSKEELLRLKEYAWTSYYFRPRYLFAFLKRFLNPKGLLQATLRVGEKVLDYVSCNRGQRFSRETSA